MICSQCGKENKSNSKFCIYCGTSFSVPEATFKLEKTFIATTDEKENDLFKMCLDTIYLLREVSAAPQVATIDLISDLTKHSAEMIENLFRQHRADLAVNRKLIEERKALDTMLEQHGVSITDPDTFKKKKEKEEEIKKAVRAKTKEVCQNVVEELEVLSAHPDEQVAGTACNAKRLIGLLQEMVIANSIINQSNGEDENV